MLQLLSLGKIENLFPNHKKPIIDDYVSEFDERTNLSNEGNGFTTYVLPMSALWETVFGFYGLQARIIQKLMAVRIYQFHPLKM